jgi:ABC-2 type transport system permease protein
MAKLWAVIKREYIERVRSKWFLIATFFGPIFFSAIIIVPAWLASRSKATNDVYNSIVLDATGEGFGRRLAINIAGGDSANASRMPSVQIVNPADLTRAESTATREVMKKERTGYIVVNQQTLAGESARYAGTNATSIADMARIKEAIRQTILGARLEKVGLDNQKMKEITFIPLEFSTERITERGRAGSGMASVLFGFAIGFLLYMSIVIYGQTIMSGVLEEKTTRVAEVVMSSVPTDTLLAGKVFGVGAVGLTQQIIWIATTYILLKARTPIMAKLGAPTVSFSLPDISLGAGILFLLFFLLGFIFYSSLYAAVGSSVNSESEARQAASPLMIMIVSTGVFIQPVLLNPTGTTAKVLSLIPISSPIIMPIRMAVTGVPTLELAGSLLFLAIGCVAALWLASRIYRVGLLMYGKRPTMREMARWVSYAG